MVGDVACGQVLQDRLLVINDPVVSLHADLAPNPQTAALARLLVASVLSDGASRMLDGDIADRASVVVTELVTNAVLHARTRVEVGICHDRHALLITVADGAPAERIITLIEPVGTMIDLGESGRGMAIVEGLTDCFGVQPRDDAPGKIVWAVIEFDTQNHGLPRPRQSVVDEVTGAGC